MKAIHRQFYPDGGLAFVLPDYKWDLCLPNGRHVRGMAADLDSAKAAIAAEHDKFVLAVWRGGQAAAGNRFVVPLGERR